MKCTVYDWVNQTVGHSKEENYISQILTKLKKAKDKVNFSKICGSKCCIMRHCVKSRKVAGSIPDDVTGIFYCLKPSGHIVALG
jgi:hypothetical protein